jgi:hypothetical protein
LGREADGTGRSNGRVQLSANMPFHYLIKIDNPQTALKINALKM